MVLGARGMMGHMLCRVLADRHEVYGTIRSRWAGEERLARFLAEGRCVSGVDVLEAGQLEAAIERVRPDVVINGVGIVKQLDTAKQAIASIECNSLLPHRAAAMCSERGVRFVHLSTDCVFSGNRGGSRESDQPDPVDLYGRSKWLGEIEGAEGLTLRTSIIGRQLHGTTGLLEWVLANRGGRVSGYTGAIYSGLTTMALARVIDSIITDHPGLAGVWHVASTPISKFDLIVAVDELLGLGMTVDPETEFMCDRSLDGSRFTARTSIEVPPWAEMLEDLRLDQPTYD